MEHVSLTEARREFFDMVNRVAYGGECITLERRGREVAVMVPVEAYRLMERLLTEEEDRQDVADAQAALKAYRAAPGEPYTLEDVIKEYDIKLEETEP